MCGHIAEKEEKNPKPLMDLESQKLKSALSLRRSLNKKKTGNIKCVTTAEEREMGVDFISSIIN